MDDVIRFQRAPLICWLAVHSLKVNTFKEILTYSQTVDDAVPDEQKLSGRPYTTNRKQSTTAIQYDFQGHTIILHTGLR